MVADGATVWERIHPLLDTILAARRQGHLLEEKQSRRRAREADLARFYRTLIEEYTGLSTRNHGAPTPLQSILELPTVSLVLDTDYNGLDAAAWATVEGDIRRVVEEAISPKLAALVNTLARPVNGVDNGLDSTEEGAKTYAELVATLHLASSVFVCRCGETLWYPQVLGHSCPLEELRSIAAEFGENFVASILTDLGRSPSATTMKEMGNLAKDGDGRGLCCLRCDSRTIQWFQTWPGMASKPIGQLFHPMLNALNPAVRSSTS